MHFHVKASWDAAPYVGGFGHCSAIRLIKWNYRINFAICQLTAGIYGFYGVGSKRHGLRMVSVVVLVHNFEISWPPDAKAAVVGKTPTIHSSGLGQCHTKIIPTCNLNNWTLFEIVVDYVRVI